MIFMWQQILIVTTLLFLLIASYTDLRWREVPDWLSFGLIFSGLGLRFIFSFENGWGIFLNGALGFLACFGIAYLFYRTNQWGGGDSKVLMGMGAVIGLGINFQNISLSNFNLLLFFLGLLLFGAIFGLLWCLFLTIRNWKSFSHEFKDLISSMKKWHLIALLFSIGFVVLSLFFNYVWPFIFFPLGGFYLLCFVKGAEKSCFIKKVDVNTLVEGDWLAEDISVGKEKITCEDNGLEKEDIWKIKSLHYEGKIGKVVVKEGIPFLPSFLLSYVVIVFGKEIVGLVF